MRATWTAVAFLAAAWLAAGQDPKLEKLAAYKPAVGDKTKVKQVTTLDYLYDFYVPHDAVGGHAKFTFTEEYTQEVLAVEGGIATKLTRAYGTYRAEIRPGKGREDREERVNVYEGKTVTIAKVADKYQFTVDGANLSGEGVEALNLEFNDGPVLRDEDLLPPGPVLVGGEWAVGRDGVERFRAAFLRVKYDPAKSKLTNKLTKQYAKDGTRYAVVTSRGTLVAVEERSGDRVMKLNDGSTVEVDVTLDVATDGRSPAGKRTATLTYRLDGVHANGRTRTVVAVR